MRDRILGPHRGYYIAVTSLLMGELGTRYRGWGKVFLAEPESVLDAGELESFYCEQEHRTVEGALDDAEDHLMAIVDALPVVAAPAAVDNLYGMLYVSRAQLHMGVEELQQLLHRARQRNAQHGITGVLLYFDETFMQYLEGPRAQLQLIYRTIRKDPLHTGLIKCLDGPVGERQFAGWSMGFDTPDMELWAAPDSQRAHLGHAVNRGAVQGMLAAFLERHSARASLLSDLRNR